MNKKNTAFKEKSLPYPYFVVYRGDLEEEERSR